MLSRLRGEGWTEGPSGGALRSLGGFLLCDQRRNPNIHVPSLVTPASLARDTQAPLAKNTDRMRRQGPSAGHKHSNTNHINKRELPTKNICTSWSLALLHCVSTPTPRLQTKATWSKDARAAAPTKGCCFLRACIDVVHRTKRGADPGLALCQCTAQHGRATEGDGGTHLQPPCLPSLDRNYPRPSPPVSPAEVGPSPLCAYAAARAHVPQEFLQTGVAEPVSTGRHLNRLPHRLAAERTLEPSLWFLQKLVIKPGHGCQFSFRSLRLQC